MLFRFFPIIFEKVENKDSGKNATTAEEEENGNIIFDEDKDAIE